MHGSKMQCSVTPWPWHSLLTTWFVLLSMKNWQQLLTFSLFHYNPDFHVPGQKGWCRLRESSAQFWLLTRIPRALCGCFWRTLGHDCLLGQLWDVVTAYRGFVIRWLLTEALTAHQLLRFHDKNDILVHHTVIELSLGCLWPARPSH